MGWNLGPLCRRHHRVKQEGWTKTRHPDGSLTWTSPTGRTFHRPSWHPTPDTAARTAAHRAPPTTADRATTEAPAARPLPSSTTRGTPPPRASPPSTRVIDDPWSGTPAIDPAQLVDPLTIPTPDDLEPDGDR